MILFRYDSKRRYTKAQEIDVLSIRKYKANGRGITFKDLMYSGLAKHKSQAQNTGTIRPPEPPIISNFFFANAIPVCCSVVINIREMTSTIEIVAFNILYLITVIL